MQRRCQPILVASRMTLAWIEATSEYVGSAKLCETGNEVVRTMGEKTSNLNKAANARLGPSRLSSETCVSFFL